MTEFFKIFYEAAVAFGPKVAIVLLVIFILLYSIYKITRSNMTSIKSYLNDRLSYSAKEHSKAIVYRKNITPKINKELNLLAEEIKADRVLLFEFSNGNSNFVGLPFLYHTATAEVIRAGNSPIAQHFQKINTCILANFFEHLENKGYFYSKDIEEVKDVYPIFYGLLKPENVKSVLLYSLYGVDDTIGFLMAATTGDNIFTRESSLPKMAETSQIISSFLNFEKLQSS